MSNTEFTPEHLKEIYDFAVQLAKDAGRMLMDGVEARCGNDTTAGVQQEQVEKDSSVDIVTQTDEGPFSDLSLSFLTSLGMLLFAFVEDDIASQGDESCSWKHLLIEYHTDVEAFVKEQITKKYPSHA